LKEVIKSVIELYNYARVLLEISPIDSQLKAKISKKLFAES